MAKARVIKKVGIIAENKTATKEINIIEWQEGYKVIDIRKWQNGDALKGISLNLMEAEKLYSLLAVAIADVKIMMNAGVEEIDIKKCGLGSLRDEDIKG